MPANSCLTAGANAISLCILLWNFDFDNPKAKQCFTIDNDIQKSIKYYLNVKLPPGFPLCFPVLYSRLDPTASFGRKLIETPLISCSQLQ